MIDLPAIRDTFLRDGYVVLPDFFSPAELTAADADMFAHYGLTRDFQHASNFKAAACEVIGWGPREEGVSSFVALHDNPRLHDATRAVLGGDYEVMGSLVMYSPPHSIGQAWHQDCPTDNPAHFNLNRLVYTRTIDANGGAVYVVPGSHRMGIIPYGEPHGDIHGQVKLEPTAGTLVFLHGMTYHRVTPVHDRPRISINFRVVPKGAPRDITNIGVYRNMKYRFSTREVVEERRP